MTDANLLLGLLDPERFLGGRMRLSLKRADDAIKRRLVRTLGGDAIEMAVAIRRRINETMAATIRGQLREPERYTMFAFGGGGPLHACGIAELVGVSRVMGFPFSSVFSAFGSSTVDVCHRYCGDNEEALRRQAMLDMRGEGFAPNDVKLECRATETGLVLESRAVIPHWLPAPCGPAKRQRVGGAVWRDVRWETLTTVVQTAIYRLHELAPGAEVMGPAIIETDATSYAVYPQWLAHIDDFGNVCMERAQE